MRTVPRLPFLCFFFILVQTSNSLATQFYVDAGRKVSATARESLPDGYACLLTRLWRFGADGRQFRK